MRFAEEILGDVPVPKRHDFKIICAPRAAKDGRRADPNGVKSQYWTQNIPDPRIPNTAAPCATTSNRPWKDVMV
jgi:hypothetical protein